MYDLKLLYIAYIADALSGGRMEYGEIKAFLQNLCEQFLFDTDKVVEIHIEWSRLGKPVATAATDAGVTTSVLH
ncbi:hypothetical protein Tco_0417058 [Tanacetum coccineum]